MNGVVIAGLPSTGKTTYLALLYHAIVEERADGLRLGRYDDDRDYVTEISDVLLAGKVADHTNVNDERDVSLSLTFEGAPLELVLPDLSGETWEHALVDRRWSQSLNAQVAAATGFMIFVHCNEINSGPTIVEADQAAAAILGDDLDESHDAEAESAATGDAEDEDEGDAGGGNEAEDGEDEEKHIKQLTQVSLVELIQFFAAAKQIPIRVSVVISAWDLEPDELNPGKWLDRNMPLLAQFLEANADEVEAKVWGVSAQGGDFGDEERRLALIEEDPITRASAQAADGTDVGIAAPLRWALRLDQ